MRVKLRRGIALLVLAALTAQLLPAMSAVAQTSPAQSLSGQALIDAQANALNQRYALFKSTCFDANGAFVDKDLQDDQGVFYSCANEYAVLSTEIPAIVKSQRSLDAQAQGSCGDSSDGILGKNGSLPSSANTIASQVPACKKQDDSSCMKDIGCNLLRSLMGPGDGGFMAQLVPSLTSKIEAGMPQEMKSCVGPSQASCVSTFVTGVIKNLWVSVEAIWGGVKYVAGKGWTALKDAGAYYGSLLGIPAAQKAESDLETKALAASTQSPSMIAQFESDPLGFLKNMFKSLVSGVKDAVISNFACSKYEGIKCVQPADNWTCATCNQKMNAICGVLGYVGGEVLTAYLTAGIATVATKTLEAVKAGVDALQISEKVMAALPKLADLDKAVQKTSEAIGATLDATKAKVIGSVVQGTADLLDHPIVARLASAASDLSKLTTNTVKAVVAGSDVVNGAVQGAKVVVNVVAAVAKKYLAVMQAATELGTEHGMLVADKLLPDALKIRRVQALEAMVARLRAEADSATGSDATQARKEADAMEKEAVRLQKTIKSGNATVAKSSSSVADTTPKAAPATTQAPAPAPAKAVNAANAGPVTTGVPVRSLPEDSPGLQAVADYQSGPQQAVIQSVLRGTKPSGVGAEAGQFFLDNQVYTQASAVQDIKNLDQLLDGSTANQDIWAFRAARSTHWSNDAQTDAGYLSTSKVQSGASSLSLAPENEIQTYPILIPKGSHVLDLTKGQGIEGFGGMDEYLLPRGTTLTPVKDASGKILYYRAGTPAVAPPLPEVAPAGANSLTSTVDPRVEALMAPQEDLAKFTQKTIFPSALEKNTAAGLHSYFETEPEAATRVLTASKTSESDIARFQDQVIKKLDADPSVPDIQSPGEAIKDGAGGDGGGADHIYLADGTTTAYFKPFGQLHPYAQTMTANGVRPLNEVTVSNFASDLGWSDLVPSAKVARVNGKLGVVMDDLKSQGYDQMTLASGVSRLKALEGAPGFQNSLQRMNVLDYITGVEDQHFNNLFYLQKDGTTKLAHIDSIQAFSDNPAALGTSARITGGVLPKEYQPQVIEDFLNQVVSGKMTPATIRAQMNGLYTAKQTESAVARFYTVLEDMKIKAAANPSEYGNLSGLFEKAENTVKAGAAKAASTAAPTAAQATQASGLAYRPRTNINYSALPGAGDMPDSARATQATQALQEAVPRDPSLPPLTAAQQQTREQGLIAAHNVGAGKAYGGYDLNDIKQKIKILKNAGYSPAERDYLIQDGWAGEQRTLGSQGMAYGTKSVGTEVTATKSVPQAQVMYLDSQGKSVVGNGSLSRTSSGDLQFTPFGNSSKPVVFGSDTRFVAARPLESNSAVKLNWKAGDPTSAAQLKLLANVPEGQGYGIKVVFKPGATADGISKYESFLNGGARTVDKAPLSQLGNNFYISKKVGNVIYIRNGTGWEIPIDLSNPTQVNQWFQSISYVDGKNPAYPGNTYLGATIQ